MKKLMATLFIAISLTSAIQANEVFNASEAITVSPFLTTLYSGGFPCKEAVEILNDAEEYALSGKLSASLNQRIQDLQTDNNELSTEEALDLLVDSANATLKQN